MSFEAARTAIQELMLGWDETPIAYDNAHSPPAVEQAKADSQPWVSLTILPGASITAAIGDGPKARQTGLIAVQIFVKPKSGTGAAYGLCDSLAERLQYKQSGAFETQALSVSRAGEVDGYFQLNANVPYRYN